MGVKVEDVGQAVKRLQHRHHRTADTKLLPLGISLVQWDALRAISRNPNASSHRLAQLTFQTDQSFGALANRLVARGLIERVTGVGRALQHRLTPQGEELLVSGHNIIHELLSASFAPLSAAELDSFYAMLTRLLEKPEDAALLRYE